MSYYDHSVKCDFFKIKYSKYSFIFLKKTSLLLVEKHVDLDEIIYLSRKNRGQFLKGNEFCF